MRTAAHTPSAAEAAASEARAQLDARLEELDRFVAEDQESPPPTAIAREALRTQLCELAAAWLEHTGEALPFPFVTVTWAGAYACEWDSPERFLGWFVNPDGSTRLHLMAVEKTRATTLSSQDAPNVRDLLETLQAVFGQAAE